MVEYREVPEDKVLIFSATPGFKGWKVFFSEDSVSHPAKMNLNLLRHILKTYTKKGDVVLDPMAGTGSTVILASNMGRHGVAVEYEAKFCKMIDENIYLLERQGGFIPRGKAVCIEGDARALSKHLIKSDVIISSPPYGNRLSDVAIQDGDRARMGYRQTVDIVLTSPPYGSDNANLQGREDESAKSVLASTGIRSIDLDPENLGNLEYGDIDAVVMSPPYEDSISAQDEDWIKEHWDDESASPKHKTMRFGKSMGGYKEVDSIITSPPYEQTESMGDKEWFESHRKEFGGGGVTGDYAPSNDNIGNLKGETYLEAMLQVYRESFKILKPLGKMVLVTKNFIREKQVVRLDLDTVKLCESVGFNLIDHLYFKLPTKSFWKILYERKYPEAPVVKYEDILVFEKGVVLPPRGRKE